MIIRVIIANVALVVAVHYAVHFGGIWHSQIHPTPNVEVSFKGGSKAIGELKQEWNGDRVLITGDGVEKRFTDDSTNYMVFTRPKNDHSLLHHWRVFAPAILILAFTIFIAIQPMRKQRQPNAL